MNKDKFISNMLILLSEYSVSFEVRRFIACQFALESNFGTSAIADENANYCGMRVPFVRPTTCIGVNRAHAKYLSISECIVDYFLWLAYNKFKQTELNDLDLFKAHLVSAHYCPSDNYISSIERIYNQMFN